MPHTRPDANDRFACGFNCAQSMLATFAPQLGVPIGLALRVAAPFGAGMGRKGQVCGALTGALMVIGLRYASEQPENKDEIYRLSREFIDQFEREHGTILCKELLGFDISTPEGLQAARDHDAFAGVCPALVDQTARALTRYLSDHLAVTG